MARSPGNKYQHLDDAYENAFSEYQQYVVYTYESEDRAEELQSFIEEYRSNYVFVTGAVFPDWIGRVEERLTTDEFDAICFLMQFGYRPSYRDLQTVRDELSGDPGSHTSAKAFYQRISYHHDAHE